MIVSLASVTTAQTNLVPNPSFEDTVDCEVSTQCSLLKAVGWYNPNTATPDVWDFDQSRYCGNPIDTSSSSSQSTGFEWPSDGIRHAGFLCWFGPGSSFSKDYLGAQLIQTMVAGQAYRVAFKCSRMDHYKYAIDGISVYFGSTMVQENHPNHLTSVTPQLHLSDPNSPFLVQSDGWLQLADTFVAVGGEQWMVMGSFDPPSLVNGTVVNPNSFYDYAYYMVDEVEVVAIGEVNAVEEIQAWFGAGGQLWLNANGVPLERVALYDALGREVFRQADVQYDNVLPWTSDLAPGPYVLVAWSGSTRWSRKLIKEERGF